MLHISLKVHIDTEKRQYLTSKVNALFSVKRLYSNEKHGIKEGLPTENGEKSVLVAGAVLFGQRPHESKEGLLFQRKPWFTSFTQSFFPPWPFKQARGHK